MMLSRKRKRRILVADDDDDFLRVTRAILEYAGFLIDTAENGEEALRALKRQKYDLLILDIIMPKVDGIKLFQMVQKSKSHSRVPVLFVSGHTARAVLPEQQWEIVKKADGLIQKPIRTKNFLEEVKTLVEK